MERQNCKLKMYQLPEFPKTNFTTSKSALGRPFTTVLEFFAVLSKLVWHIDLISVKNCIVLTFY